MSKNKNARRGARISVCTVDDYSGINEEDLGLHQITFEEYLGEDTYADTNGTEYGETDVGVIPVAISDEDLTFKEKMLEKLLRAGSKDKAEEKKLMKKLKRKGRKKKETPVSDVRIGKILDSVAAEEFGGQMSEEEIKTLAKLYLTLYKSSIRKLPFPKWLVCHYFGHRV